MISNQSTAISFRDSLRRLQTAQKSSRGAPIYSLLVNRPLGRLAAAAAHQAGMSPNQVTLVSAVFTLTGIALLAVSEPNWFSAALITLALVAGYGLDAADGQLARLTGGGSLSGEWLDHVIDSAKIATLHLAVLIMIFRFFGLGTWSLAVPLVFSAAYVVHFFAMLLTDLLIRVRKAGAEAGVLAGPPSRVVSLLKLPTDYGILCLSFLLLGAPRVFFAVYALLALAMLGYTVLVLPVWYGRLRRLN
jgi:phosphatidylglycerophosphate synthase